MLKSNGFKLLLVAVLMILTGCIYTEPREIDLEWPGDEVGTSFETQTAVTESEGASVASDQSENSENSNQKNEEGSWAIYWYMCGSDLESDGGFATKDLEEMLSVTLPENVQIIIETGGTTVWQNDLISADELGRYLYAGNTLSKISAEPDANMSDPETLTDFLQFCNANYPAEHQVVILWDHGGGSLGGVICDEREKGDAMQLYELSNVFNSAAASSGKYEIIGFDACLMATIDTMDAIDEYAKYMVASEENEPGCGWEYAGLLSTFSQEIITDGSILGRAICDSFYEGCEKEQSESMATLSLLDLSKAPAMIEAYKNLGDEALLNGVMEQNQYFSEFGNTALNSENYGGNNDQTGYFNMMDIGDFLSISGTSLFPETGEQAMNALQDLVLYQIKGELRSRANGLSCYYSYDGSTDYFQLYTEIADCPGFEFFYEYSLTGDLTEEGRDYVRSIQAETDTTATEVLPMVSDLEGVYLTPVVTEDGRYMLDLSQYKDQIAQVYLHVYTYDHYNMNFIMDLGICNAVDVSSQDQGIYLDTFEGEWAVMKEIGFDAYSNPIYLSIIDRVPDVYTIYATPILLNNEDYQLILYLDEMSGVYEVLGANKGMDESTLMADKNLRKLAPGDSIIPISRMSILLEDETFSDMEWMKPTAEELEYGVFNVTDQLEVVDMMWIDGIYLVEFVIIDYQGNQYESDSCYYQSEEDGTLRPITFEELYGYN
ncbi:MAG: clostripain-related cysteine peptidase [Lachnospiraceae bacterium]